ncbi:MAG: flagellar type III secretion system pore protein FliP, partial [Tumebacillaceae bacterium]
MNKQFRYLLLFIVMLLPLLLPHPAYAANTAPVVPGIPGVNIGVSTSDTPQSTATSLQIIAMLTVLSLAPSILILMTCFTRIVIVLSFVRNALALQQMPPTQVLIGLALFLTFFVMAPTFSQVN